MIPRNNKNKVISKQNLFGYLNFTISSFNFLFDVSKV